MSYYPEQADNLWYAADDFDDQIDHLLPAHEQSNTTSYRSAQPLPASFTAAGEPHQPDAIHYDPFSSLEDIQRWNEQHGPPSPSPNGWATRQGASQHHQFQDHEASVDHFSAGARQTDQDDPLPEDESDVEEGETKDSAHSKRDLKKGEIRYVRGDLQVKQGTQWHPASYHHDLREEILQRYPPAAYDVSPARGASRSDQTSFWKPHKSLNFESRDDYPDIVLQWIPPEQKSFGKVSPLMYKGRIVIDFNNRIIRDFQMPFCLSSELEGARLEYISRTNKISPSKADYAARMPVDKDKKGGLKSRVVANAVGMKKLRFRNLHALVPFETRACSLDRKRALIQCIPGEIMAEILITNSTRPWRTTSPLERAYIEAPNRGKHLEKAGKHALKDTERSRRHEMESKRVGKFAPPNLPAWPYGDDIGDDAAAVRAARTSWGLSPNDLTPSETSKRLAGPQSHSNTAVQKKRSRDVNDSTAAEYATVGQEKRRRLQRTDASTARDNSGTAGEETSSRRPPPQRRPNIASGNNSRSDRPRPSAKTNSRLSQSHRDMPGQKNSLPYGYKGLEGQAPASIPSKQASSQPLTQAEEAAERSRSARQSNMVGWDPIDQFGNLARNSYDLAPLSADWSQPLETAQNSDQYCSAGGSANYFDRLSNGTRHPRTLSTRGNVLPGNRHQPWGTDPSCQGSFSRSYAQPLDTWNSGFGDFDRPRDAPPTQYGMGSQLRRSGGARVSNVGRSDQGQAANNPRPGWIVGHRGGPNYPVWAPLDLGSPAQGAGDPVRFHSNHSTARHPQAVAGDLARAKSLQFDHGMPPPRSLGRETRVEKRDNPNNAAAGSSGVNIGPQYRRSDGPSQSVDCGIPPSDHVQNIPGGQEAPGAEASSQSISNAKPVVNEEPTAEEDWSELFPENSFLGSIMNMSREELKNSSGGWTR
ncbi:MAG: hypothetical protein Q9183_003621 [Haloplaca sp. 2 TL-2023]